MATEPAYSLAKRDRVLSTRAPHSHRYASQRNQTGHQYVNDPTMMGGSKHFDAILESMRNARREAAKTATKADTGSGDMDTSTSSAVATTALATTPATQVKPTRETLAATLAACQAALEKLDDDNDSPAAAVKKRRKSTQHRHGNGYFFHSVITVVAPLPLGITG